MTLADDALWSPYHLKAEGHQTSPLAQLVSLIQTFGFTSPFPQSLLDKLASIPSATANGNHPQLQTVPPTGEAELNAIQTIIGYHQSPRLLSSLGRTRYFVPVLKACLLRLKEKLQQELQSSSAVLSVLHFLQESDDVVRDLISIYFETDCEGKWVIEDDIQSTLRKTILDILKLLCLQGGRSNEKLHQQESVVDDDDEGKVRSKLSGDLKRVPYSVLAGLADFCIYQFYFKNGADLESRLTLVYKSSHSTAILPYLPEEAQLRAFISNTWTPNSPRRKDPYLLDPIDSNGAFGAALRIMTRASSCAWTCTPCKSFPSNLQRYSTKQQRINYDKIRKLTKRSNDISKIQSRKKTTFPSPPPPSDDSARKSTRKNYGTHHFLDETKSSWTGRMIIRLLASCTCLTPTDKERRKQNQLKQINRQIAATGLGLESSLWIEHLGISGMFHQLRKFSLRIAKEYPEISNTDGERQAVRNLWACFGLEMILFGEKVYFWNNAIFGYSMMYPKTDNFLDDNRVSREEKVKFQKEFHKRIRGDVTEVDGEGGEALRKVLEELSELVGMIEETWPRREYPALYLGSLALNAAQTMSITVQRTAINSREKIMETTFYKGGASVLTDAYLVKGDISFEEAGFAYILGCCLQMIDDAQDVEEDVGLNHETLYTPRQGDSSWDQEVIDANAYRLFWFLSNVWLREPESLESSTKKRSVVRHSKGERNDTVIKTTLRISQMMSLKSIMKGKSVFSPSLIKEAAKCCSVEPKAMMKLHGISFLHKLAKLDQI